MHTTRLNNALPYIDGVRRLYSHILYVAFGAHHGISMHVYYGPDYTDKQVIVPLK